MVREWVCRVRVRRPFASRTVFCVELFGQAQRTEAVRVCLRARATHAGIIQIFEKQLKVRQQKPRAMRMDYHAVTRLSSMIRDAVMTAYDQLSHLDACVRRVAINEVVASLTIPPSRIGLVGAGTGQRIGLPFPSPAVLRLSGSRSEHFTFLFYHCAFCRLIQELNPTMRNITYDINDLYSYIDSMPDLSCLVFDHGTSQYQPYTKEWIKKRVYQLLKKQAT